MKAESGCGYHAADNGMTARSGSGRAGHRSPLGWVFMVLMIGGAALWVSGCSKDDCIDCVDKDPPATPTGVHSVTGDGLVTVYWNDVDEADIAGYRVYWNQDGGSTYDFLAELQQNQNFDPTTGLHYYIDTDVVNGSTYYYAVTSFDHNGNQSNLSYELVYDTPRPAGTNVELFDPAVAAPLSGFDFSALGSGRVSGTASTADIAISWQAGTPFVVSARPAIVSLQDYGTVMDDAGNINLDWVSFAPLGGYSLTGRAELILGHAYVVRIVENPATDVHYAKFDVTAVRTSSVVIDWAYQIANDNRELKAIFGPSNRGGNRAAGADVVRF